MEKLKNQLNGIKTFFGTDWNIVRLRRLVKRGFRAAPRGTARYLADKVPAAQWIGGYKPKWAAFDLLSGLTVGLVLVLQAVNFAQPIPGGLTIQQTLTSIWLPGFIYSLTGTSKNMSIGPTATSTVLSFPLVASISSLAKIPPQFIYPAVTFGVGLWFAIFGVLGLGFIFDLIPVFFCIALVTAFAIITIMLQAPVLLGLLNVAPEFQAVLGGVVANLGNTSGRTVAISISAIVFLALLRFLHLKWGAERSVRGTVSQVGKALGGLLVIVIFTGVSSVFLSPLPIQQQLAPFIPPLALTAQAAPMAAGPGAAGPGAGAGAGAGVAPQAALASNATIAEVGASAPQPTGSLAMVDPMLRRAVGVAGRQAPANLSTATTAAAATAGGAEADADAPVPKLPFWSAFPVFNTMLAGTRIPSMQLATGLFLPSFIVFLGINIEHIVVARFFGNEQGYSISKSQEMFSLGVINIVNSLFGGVPVGGGDMTRASVLGFAGSKSPLNQVFASVAVIIAMGPASGALRFLPQAALAAITFMAIFDQMPPQTLMNVYFKLSFADFFAFFIVMNVSIPAPSGINVLLGTGLGLVYMILYTLFRGMFASPKIIKSFDLESTQKEPWVQYLVVEKDTIPASTLVVKLDADLVWTNTERMHRHIMNGAFLYNSGLANEQIGKPELPWNMRVHKRMGSVRRQHERQKPDMPISFRPRLRMVILDFSTVSFADTSALMNLELAKKQLRHWAGDEVEFRFVGLNKHLLRRFQRAKWPLQNAYDQEDVVEVEKGAEDSGMKDLTFSTLHQALRYRRQDDGMESTYESIIEDGMDIGKGY